MLFRPSRRRTSLPPRRSSHRTTLWRVGALALAATASAGLAGCSPAAVSPAQHPQKSAATVTVDNCGTPVQFSAAPRRVITIKSTSTEMLLALGLGDRIVGTAFQDGPVPDRWAAAAAKLPVLAERVPSQEVVLNADPDLVYAGWESNFSADGAGTRADLAALGVASYVSPSACKEPAYKPAKLHFDDIFAEIGEVAKIFRVDDTALLKQQRAELASVTPDARGLTALWYSSGSDTPYVGAGIGAPELLLESVGLKNIAGSVADTWTSFNWEAVIDANPDVIVLVDASWNTVAHKIQVLESNPATANLDAVKHHRYLTVPFAASEAGVRTVSAAADLAAQLAKLKLG
jgi:iron complex transport system substrate-binding protein